MRTRTSRTKQAPSLAHTFDAWWKEEHGSIEDMLIPFIAEMRVLFQEAWEAGYQAADQEWRQHILRGLGDDPQETTQHMMQRW